MVAGLFQSVVPRYPELKGKVAIVTGASRGIGLGIAARLAAEQARLVIAGLEADAVRSVVNDLCELGVEAYGVPGDLSRDEHVTRLMNETIREFGGVDLLVNNAADLKRTRLAAMEADLLNRQIAVNLRAPLLLAQMAAAVMPGGSSIVNISSVGGLRAHEDAFPYDVTKGAIDAMTRALAVDLAERNVRVNAVAPGSVASRCAAHYRNMEDENSAYQDAVHRIPLGRRASVTEIGAVVAFLASNDAAYITGQVIYVDGGLTAQLTPAGFPV